MSSNNDLYEEAENRGLEVVKGDGSHLQLDLDTPQTQANLEAYQLLRQYSVIAGDNLITVSQHGKQHEYIPLSIDPFTKQTFDQIVRIAMQACLGSDPKREMLSLLGVLGYTGAVEGHEIALFETQEEFEKAEGWVDKNKARINALWLAVDDNNPF
jgi:hypothetical protein